MGTKHEIRMGRIKAVIWTNETDAGPRHNVTFCRLYKEGSEWMVSDSFGRDDLPLVARIADMTHTWIYEQAAAASGESRQRQDDIPPEVPPGEPVGQS
jgi:hypothetical protein